MNDELHSQTMYVDTIQDLRAGRVRVSLRTQAAAGGPGVPGAGGGGSYVVDMAAPDQPLVPGEAMTVTVARGAAEEER